MPPSLFALLKQRRNREALYCTEHYWDSKALDYDSLSVSMWPNQLLNQEYMKEQEDCVLKVLGDISGQVVLDLGCGTGRFSRWFALQGADVTGLDFSVNSLDIARRCSGSNPCYRAGSIFEFDCHGAYDIIFTCVTLTIACRDAGQLLDALSRIKAALKPGGRLLIVEPIHRGFLHRVLDLGLADFVAVMESAGYQVKYHEFLHFWPMRLALAYINWPKWVTVPLYRLGQSLMRLPFFSGLGDYSVILAQTHEN